MQIIAGYNFNLNYSLYGTIFNDVPGVYIIYTSSPTRILDVGETHQLKTRLESHERKLLWLLNSGSQQILVAFHTEGNSIWRLIKEKTLRGILNPICGQR